MSQSDDFEREKGKHKESIHAKEHVADNKPYTKLDILSLVRKLRLKARDVFDAIVSQEESKVAQHAILGSIEVTEDLQKDLLTP